MNPTARSTSRWPIWVALSVLTAAALLVGQGRNAGAQDADVQQLKEKLRVVLEDIDARDQKIQALESEIRNRGQVIEKLETDLKRWYQQADGVKQLSADIKQLGIQVQQLVEASKK